MKRLMMVLSALGIAACGGGCGQHNDSNPGIPSVPRIDAANWGSITAPVYGTSETSPYVGAELFAGPNKPGRVGMAHVSFEPRLEWWAVPTLQDYKIAKSGRVT